PMANDSYRILCTRWELKSRSPPRGGFCYVDQRHGTVEGSLSVDCGGERARRLGSILVLRHRRAPHWRDLSWGTIIVNILGSFIIGFFATLTGPDGRLFSHTLTRHILM